MSTDLFSAAILLVLVLVINLMCVFILLQFYL